MRIGNKDIQVTGLLPNKEIVDHGLVLNLRTGVGVIALTEITSITASLFGLGVGVVITTIPDVVVAAPEVPPAAPTPSPAPEAANESNPPV